MIGHLDGFACRLKVGFCCIDRGFAGGLGRRCRGAQFLDFLLSGRKTSPKEFQLGLESGAQFGIVVLEVDHGVSLFHHGSLDDVPLSHLPRNPRRQHLGAFDGRIGDHGTAALHSLLPWHEGQYERRGGHAPEHDPGNPPDNLRGFRRACQILPGHRSSAGSFFVCLAEAHGIVTVVPMRSATSRLVVATIRVQGASGADSLSISAG